LGAALIDGIGLSIIDVIFRGIMGTPGNGVGLLLGLAYYGYLEGSPSGQTVGKRIVGIRVIDFQTGGPLGVGRALIRYVARFISGIACFIGYLWMLWDAEKQTWHDKIANCVVVPTSSYPVEAWPG
jgi:uncharacterized RDD family membrane protein YckC